MEIRKLEKRTVRLEHIKSLVASCATLMLERTPQSGISFVSQETSSVCLVEYFVVRPK